MSRRQAVRVLTRLSRGTGKSACLHNFSRTFMP